MHDDRGHSGPTWRTDIARRHRYSQGGGIYRIIPAAVARPVDISELRETIAAAALAGLPVTLRGAGSAMDGGNVGSGVVVDMTGFDAGRCDIDAGARTALVSPSLRLAELQRLARPHGLHFPVDPSSADWATLGGMAGTNAAGTRTIRDGPTRDWIEELVLETSDGPLRLARGEAPDPGHPVIERWRRTAEPLLERHRGALLARWPRTRKNTFGYALDRWFGDRELIDPVIGSEGTLGAITALTLRLAPLAAHRATISVSLGNRGELVPVIEALDRAGAVRIEFFDRTFLRIAEEGDGARAMLIADFEGEDRRELDRRGVDASMAAAAAAGAGARIELAAGAEADELWRIRHGVSSRLAGLSDGRRSLQVIEDGCVPRDRIVDYLDGVEAAATGRGIGVVMFGHAGDGHVHANLLVDPDESDWLERVTGIFEEISELQLRLGGTPAGEHGAGRLRAGLVRRFLGDAGVESFLAVKRAFDPAGLWNPGVIVGERGDPFRWGLKVGGAAAPLPDDVAALLRRVETERRWGDDRWVPWLS